MGDLFCGSRTVNLCNDLLLHLFTSTSLRIGWKIKKNCQFGHFHFGVTFMTTKHVCIACKRPLVACLENCVSKQIFMMMCFARCCIETMKIFGKTYTNTCRARSPPLKSSISFNFLPVPSFRVREIVSPHKSRAKSSVF